VVKITVTAQGDIEDPTLTLSTGYPALDEACLAGFRGQHMKPAIRDGKPATITAEMPVVWKLSSSIDLRVQGSVIAVERVLDRGAHRMALCAMLINLEWLVAWGCSRANDGCFSAAAAHVFILS
jgi:TonB family protein